MNTLNKYFLDTMASFYTPSNIYLEIMKSKLKKINIVITKRQEKKLLKNFDKGKFQINISNSQIKKSGYTEEELQVKFKKIVDEMEIHIEEYGKLMEEEMSDFTTHISDELSQLIYTNLITTFKKFRKFKENERALINEDILNAWNKSFENLEMTLFMTQEIIESYANNEEVNNTSKNLVLIKLLSKGCQIFSEIIILLNNGLPDGAYARWRSLHEITVIAEYLSDKSEETFEKFIDHQHVQDYKHARKLKEDTNHLFQFEVTDEEYNIICENYNYVVNKYGRSFKNDYGWAYEFFDQKRIHFSDLEHAVDFDNIRSHYKMSSDTIHTNSRGLFYNVGLFSKSEFDLLIGPSIHGLSIPISLVSTSITLLLTNVLLKINDEVVMDELVYLKIFHLLRENIVSNCFEEEDNLLD